MAAQVRQCLAKGLHAIKLAVVAQLSPARVIAILFALSGIAAGGLQMPTWIGTDPYIDIGRWNRQCADALQLLAVPDVPAIDIAIAEALAMSQPTDAGLCIADVDQP